MTDTRIRTTKDGAFAWGYYDHPSQLCGTMTPFRPGWWAQYLGDGTHEFFDTRKECLAWIKEWDEIDP